MPEEQFIAFYKQRNYEFMVRQFYRVGRAGRQLHQPPEREYDKPRRQQHEQFCNAETVQTSLRTTASEIITA